MTPGAMLDVLPPYKGDQRLVNKRQDTFDIIREILRKHKACVDHYDILVQKFPDLWKGDAPRTAENLFYFAKQNLPYRVEPTLKQTVKTPAAILEERFDFGNDCKHYASFIVGMAEALRRQGKPVKVFYRFGSYDKKKRSPGHVFAVIVDQGREIWVDPVPEIGGFNKRFRSPVYHLDKMPPMSKNGNSISGLYDISGLQLSGSGMAPNRLVAGYPSANLVAGARGAHWLDRPGAGDIMEDIGRTKKKKPAHHKKAPHTKKHHKGLHIKVKPGKLLAKYGLATSRNAFLTLEKLNVFHLATKAWPHVKDKNSPAWKKMAATWQKHGGKPDVLWHNIRLGVNTYNKLHPKHKVSGYDDLYVMNGTDDMLSGCGDLGYPDDIGYYSDDMTIGDILAFVHDNHNHHTNRRRRQRSGHAMGVAQVAVAAGVIAAATPLLKAFAGIFKSFGINTDKAEETADQDTEDLAAKHNDSGDGTGPDGTTTHDDGTETKVVDKADGTQELQVKNIPGLKDEGGGDDTITKTKTKTKTEKDTETEDGDEEDQTTTKTKTITKHKGGGGGMDFAGMMANVTAFVSDHKYWFIGGGLAIAAVIILPKIFSNKPKRRR